jgi:hypothetical protein
MMAEKKVTVKFNKERETKGTFVYTEDADPVQVGSLYLKKAAAAELGNPESIIVVITAGA